MLTGRLPGQQVSSLYEITNTVFRVRHLAKVNNNEIALGMYAWGFGGPTEDGSKFETSSGVVLEYDAITIEDYWNELKIAYTVDDVVDYDELSGTENAGTSLFDFAKEIFISTEGPKDPAAGGAITKIEGVEKTGDYSLKITMTKFDAVSKYQLGITVTPLHYYGDAAKYDYANNKFGFDKGDLSTVKAKTTQPMGAGAYKFIKFENGIVNFERNEYYFKGKPRITYIKFQEVTTEDDKVTSLKTGSIDITDPTVSDSILNAIKEANSNGALTGNKITYNAVDNLGYGYIGINADNVKVGTDKASEASESPQGLCHPLRCLQRYRYQVLLRRQSRGYPVPHFQHILGCSPSCRQRLCNCLLKDVEGNAIFTRHDCRRRPKRKTGSYRILQSSHYLGRNKRSSPPLPALP